MGKSQFLQDVSQPLRPKLICLVYLFIFLGVCVFIYFVSFFCALKNTQHTQCVNIDYIDIKHMVTSRKPPTTNQRRADRDRSYPVCGMMHIKEPFNVFFKYLLKVCLCVCVCVCVCVIFIVSHVGPIGNLVFPHPPRQVPSFYTVLIFEIYFYNSFYNLEFYHASNILYRIYTCQNLLVLTSVKSATIVYITKPTHMLVTFLLVW